MSVPQLTERAFSRRRCVVAARATLVRGDRMEVAVMSTIWTLIEVCFADARKAEELVSQSRGRREIAMDPEPALASFSLWKGGLPAATRRTEKVAKRATALEVARA